MEKLNKVNINEFKEYLKSLIEARKLGKKLDFNKEICEKYNLVMLDRGGVTLTSTWLDGIGEDNKDRTFLDALLDEIVFEESYEINLDLRKNNYCSSYYYSEIVLDENIYLIPTHSFINNNYTSDYYMNFNCIIDKNELLNNFPKGRCLEFNIDKTMLEDMVDIKDTLKDDESLNYYAKRLINKIPSREGSEFLHIDEVGRLGHSLVEHDDYFEIKDYDNNLFRVNKVEGSRLDFDTIERI